MKSDLPLVSCVCGLSFSVRTRVAQQVRGDWFEPAAFDFWSRQLVHTERAKLGKVCRVYGIKFRETMGIVAVICDKLMDTWRREAV